jgi:hypothetical protein
MSTPLVIDGAMLAKTRYVQRTNNIPSVFISSNMIKTRFFTGDPHDATRSNGIGGHRDVPWILLGDG